MLADDGFNGLLRRFQSVSMTPKHFHLSVEGRRSAMSQKASIAIHLCPQFLPVGFNERAVVNPW
jgi:hypothetical protein